MMGLRYRLEWLGILILEITKQRNSEHQDPHQNKATFVAKEHKNIRAILGSHWDDGNKMETTRDYRDYIGSKNVK